ncbi:MAG: outer membrane lipoprotein carrier protein LolA [Holosporaceae bacterium]|jgi:outer membrane lipoprotein-sorting protein|nr:outer membrane lipoprotein carrier protein LolA [Holosporaceae bacterium]
MIFKAARSRMTENTNFSYSLLVTSLREGRSPTRQSVYGLTRFVASLLAITRRFKFLPIALFCLFFTAIGDELADYIVKVEQYLNNITTFEADFIQIDRSGRVFLGRFFLKRPFLMKMDYTDPAIKVIIAKENKVVVYDRELMEKTETSTYSSPLSFFLERKINLRDNVDLLSIKNEDNYLFLKFCKKDKNAEGAVMLIFSKKPLILRGWIVFSDKNDESPSKSTEISFAKQKSGHFISDKEFERF